MSYLRDTSSNSIINDFFLNIPTYNYLNFQKYLTFLLTTEFGICQQHWIFLQMEFSFFQFMEYFFQI